MELHRPSDRSLIERAFFEQPPLDCARGLIGQFLVWGRCRGVIVETEAYAAEGDEACHTFARPSTRAFVSRHRAGHAYVYLNYGVHWLFNVLLKGSVEGFVLIRALEPVAGIAAMRRRRGVERGECLCAGPGRLTRAMGIDGTAHGVDLCRSTTRGFQWNPEAAGDIVAAPRIGISKATALPWRFGLAGNPHLSRPV